MQLMAKSNFPWVIGTTGLDWQHVDQLIKGTLKAPWIYAANFSLGMLMLKRSLRTLSGMANLLGKDQISYALHEEHHLYKKDQPSGTAIEWAQIFGIKTEACSSLRLGDIVGNHTLSLNTPGESITISHQANSRETFAHGVWWAIKQLRQLPTLGRECKLIHLESLIDLSLSLEERRL